MFKLQFTIFAIYGMFACQANAHDTAQIVQEECNNMGMTGSECEIFSITRVKQMTPEMPSRMISNAPFHQKMEYSMIIMNHAMDNAPLTGNADDDFAAMMIPHHQGAADIAKVELLYGKDSALKRLAQEIIVTQGSEIDVMKMHLQQSAIQLKDGGHE